MNKETKPDIKWYTNKCTVCGEAHYNIKSEYDQFKKEYVVCEKTNKKVYINRDWMRETT